jgi:hypothetical protein
MGCSHPFDRTFLTNAMGTVFVNRVYKEHRQSVLYDREKARLPATVEAAELTKRVRQMTGEQADMRAQRRDVQGEIMELVGARHQAMRAAGGAGGEGVEAVLALRRDLERRRAILDVEISYRKELVAHLQARIRSARHGGTGGFVRGCPKQGCRGFLGADWKCSLCASHACKDCHEILGVGGDGGAEGAAHVCREEDVATAKLIAADSKPCPKCSAMIHKVDGCDQMFCVQCHTAFDWRTGEVETGTIHNPHFFDMMRRMRGGAAALPRAPGDVICGGMPGLTEIEEAVVNAGMGDREWAVLGGARTLYFDIAETELPRVRGNAFEDNLELRIGFLLGDVDEGGFKKALFKKEKSAEKRGEMAEVLQTTADMILDAVQRVVIGGEGGDGVEGGVEGGCEEIREIIRCANGAMADVAKRFDLGTCMVIDERNFKIIRGVVAALV